MGKNTEKGYRIGPVNDRSQVYNEKTKQYVKRDTTTGKIMATKATPFKGVKLTKSDKPPSKISKK